MKINHNRSTSFSKENCFFDHEYFILTQVNDVFTSSGSGS